MKNMHILARVDSCAAQALLRSLRPSWQLHNVNAFSELTRAAATMAHDAIVLDPLDPDLGALHQDTSLAYCIACRRLVLPVIFLCPVEVAAFDRVVRMARSMPVFVIYRFSQDSIADPCSVIEEAVGTRLSSRVFATLRSQLAAGLAGPTMDALEHLFRQPAAFAYETHALSALRISATGLSVWLRQNGLAPFHVLRRVARVAQTYEYLRAFGLSLKEVRNRVGVGSIDSLLRETRLLTGSSPGQLVSRVAPDDFLELAVRSCFRSAQEWPSRRPLQ